MPDPLETFQKLRRVAGVDPLRRGVLRFGGWCSVGGRFPLCCRFIVSKGPPSPRQQCGNHCVPGVCCVLSRVARLLVERRPGA